MAVVVANAVNAETERGHLGLLNWLGERLLYLSHLQRPNTIKGTDGAVISEVGIGGAVGGRE